MLVNLAGVIRVLGDQGAPVGGSTNELDTLGQPHIIEGPSANPEPPPEGQSPPVINPTDVDGNGEPLPPDPTSLLPPPFREAPPGDPHPIVQAAVEDYTKVQNSTGRTIMEVLRQNRKWCNPDFLEKMVRFYDLDQYGSSFAAEVWNPKALHEEDYWPQVQKAAAAEQARRAEENARRQQIQFQSAGLQKPTLLPAPNKVAKSQAEMLAKLASMQKAKSKWDVAGGR